MRQWHEEGFVGEVLAAYPLALDGAFARRLAFLARVMSLDWLWESRERGTDVGKHRRWVENAFSDPSAG